MVPIDRYPPAASPQRGDDMRRNWRAILGLLMVLVLGAAACSSGDDSGSSDDDGSSSETTESQNISGDDWVEEADGLCEDWLDVGNESNGGDPDDVADLADATRDFADAVEELGTPDGLEDEADELVDTLGDLADNLDEASGQLEDN